MFDRKNTSVDFVERSRRITVIVYSRHSYCFSVRNCRLFVNYEQRLFIRLLNFTLFRPKKVRLCHHIKVVLVFTKMSINLCLWCIYLLANSVKQMRFSPVTFKLIVTFDHFIFLFNKTFTQCNKKIRRFFFITFITTVYSIWFRVVTCILKRDNLSFYSNRAILKRPPKTSGRPQHYPICYRTRFSNLTRKIPN